MKVKFEFEDRTMSTVGYKFQAPSGAVDATPAGRLPESERSGKSQDGFAAEALGSDESKASIEVPQDMTAAPTGEAEPAANCWYCGAASFEPCQMPFNDVQCRRAPQPTQQQAAAVVDFCGLQQELSERQTDRGTPYSIERWTCPNCGKACSSLILDDEWCHGDSLSISFGPEKDADGTWTRHHKCNACWLAAPPPAGQRATVPEDRHTPTWEAFKQQFAHLNVESRSKAWQGWKAGVAHAAGQVPQPLSPEQIDELVKKHTWFNGSHAMTDYTALARALEAAHHIVAGETAKPGEGI